MKRIVMLSIVASLSLLAASSFTNRLYHHVEDRTVYTDWYSTPNLDQHMIGPGSGCDPSVDRNSCYMATNIELHSTNEHWVLDGDPTLECDGGVPQGSSAQWNHLDRVWQTLITEGRVTVLLHNPDQIKVKLLTGSGSIRVRLKCQEHNID